MVKYFENIEPDLAEWAMQQSVFFTASAPTHGKHVNLSPKGLPSSSFSIISPNLAAYVDATGSGNETISHILENGRVTVMFCSFSTAPRILRFFCKGRVIEWDQRDEFESWLTRMGGKEIVGARAIILLDVFKVQTSCGFGVPMLTMIPSPTDKPTPTPAITYTPNLPPNWDLEKHPQPSGPMIPTLVDRATMGHWAGQMISKEKLNAYRAEWNSESLDGLPGLRSAQAEKKKLGIKGLKMGVVKPDNVFLGLRVEELVRLFLVLFLGLAAGFWGSKTFF